MIYSLNNSPPNIIFHLKYYIFSENFYQKISLPVNGKAPILHCTCIEIRNCYLLQFTDTMCSICDICCRVQCSNYCTSVWIYKKTVHLGIWSWTYDRVNGSIHSRSPGTCQIRNNKTNEITRHFRCGCELNSSCRPKKYIYPIL